MQWTDDKRNLQGLMVAEPTWAQADSVQLCVLLPPIHSANSSAPPLGIHPMVVVRLPTIVLNPTPTVTEQGTWTMTGRLEFASGFHHSAQAGRRDLGWHK